MKLTKARIINVSCTGLFVLLKFENQKLEWVFHTELIKYQIENEEILITK